MSLAPDDDDLTQPFTCPECGDSGARQRFASLDYNCPGCNLSVAHVDLAPTGMVREVYGWLLIPGTLLAGRYKVNGLLGRGGFAATYGVADTRLANRRCALKEVPKMLFDSREMEILSGLDHPGIPSIRDKFELGSMVYLVLEFGGRRSLGMERVERGGTIPVDTLLPWISQLCGVLEYLHAQDPPVVHRDLKPGNILLTDDGRINLIDFGIAKETEVDAKTRTIARSATHGFSPPEQVLGTGTDERSDVYSLGATLFQLLTGQRPPPAHERVAGAELARPGSLVDGISSALDSLILRAMELNIHKRIQSIHDFAVRLDAIAAGQPMPLTLPDAERSSAEDASNRGAGRGRRRGEGHKAPARLSDEETLYLGSEPGAPRSRRISPALTAFLILGLAGAGGAIWWMQRASETQRDAPEPIAVIQETAPPRLGLRPVESPDSLMNATTAEPKTPANLAVTSAMGIEVEPAPESLKLKHLREPSLPTHDPPTQEPMPIAAVVRAEAEPIPVISALRVNLALDPVVAEVRVKPELDPLVAKIRVEPDPKPATATAWVDPESRATTLAPAGLAAPATIPVSGSQPAEGEDSQSSIPAETELDWGAGFKKGSARRVD